jgi:hypothetical protein
MQSLRVSGGSLRERKQLFDRDLQFAGEAQRNFSVRHKGSALDGINGLAAGAGAAREFRGTDPSADSYFVKAVVDGVHG